MCVETSRKRNACIVPLNLLDPSFIWVPPFGWNKVSDAFMGLLPLRCTWKGV